MEQEWLKLAFHRAWMFAPLQISVSKPIQEQDLGQPIDVAQPGNVILDQILTGGLIVEAIVVVDLIGVQRDQRIQQGDRPFRPYERGKPQAQHRRKSRQPFGLEREGIDFGDLGQIRKWISYPRHVQIGINYMRMNFDQLPDEEYFLPRNIGKRSRTETGILLGLQFSLGQLLSPDYPDLSGMQPCDPLHGFERIFRAADANLISVNSHPQESLNRV